MKIKERIKRMIPDSIFLKYRFKKEIGYKLNLKEPKTFNEKLQWLKLYDRKPLYTMLVDKYEVKKYVAEQIGEEYVIPTYGVWNCFNDINFEILPEQFVMKCTHDSGTIVICKDKSTFDYALAKEKIEISLKNKHYYTSREWPYKNVKPRIIAEKYMEDEKDQELRDYKFYTFNGKPYYLLLATGRQSENKELCFDYFDMNFYHLKLTNHWHPNALVIPHKPYQFEKMKELAQILAKDIPHVRVDFYEVNGQIYFGEMTFFAMGGHLKIHPDDWDIEWGKLIELPRKTI